MASNPEELFEPHGPAVVAEVQRQTKRFGSLGVVLRALHCEVPRSLTDQYRVLANYLEQAEGGILTFLNEANAVAAPRPKPTIGVSGAAIRREAGPMRVDPSATAVFPAGSTPGNPSATSAQTQVRPGPGAGGPRYADPGATTVMRPGGGSSQPASMTPGSYAYHELAETQIRPNIPDGQPPQTRGGAAAALNSPHTYNTPPVGMPKQTGAVPSAPPPMATPHPDVGGGGPPYTGPDRRSGIERRINVADRRQKLEVTFRNRRFGGWDRRKIFRRTDDRVKKGVQAH